MFFALTGEKSVEETQVSSKIGNFLLNRCEFGGTSGVIRGNTEPAGREIYRACVETEGHRT